MSDESLHTEAEPQFAARVVIALGRTFADVDHELDMLGSGLSLRTRSYSLDGESWERIDETLTALGAPLASGFVVSWGSGISAQLPTALESPPQSLDHESTPSIVQQDAASSEETRHDVPLPPLTDELGSLDVVIAQTDVAVYPPPTAPQDELDERPSATESEQSAAADLTVFDAEDVRYATVEDMLRDESVWEAPQSTSAFGELGDAALVLDDPFEPSALETVLDETPLATEERQALADSLPPRGLTSEAPPEEPLALIDDEPLVLGDSLEAMPPDEAPIALTEGDETRLFIDEEAIIVDEVAEQDKGSTNDEPLLAAREPAHPVPGAPSEGAASGDDLGELVFNVEPVLDVAAQLASEPLRSGVASAAPPSRASEQPDNLELDLSEFMTAEEPTLQPLPLLRPPPPPPQRSAPPPVPRASRPIIDVEDIEELDVQDIELDATSSSPPASTSEAKSR